MYAFFFFKVVKISSFSNDTVFCLMRTRERLSRTTHPPIPTATQPTNMSHFSSSSSFSQVFFPFFFLHFILCFKGLNMQNSKNYTQIIQPKLSTHILGHFNVVILMFTSFFFFPFFIFIFYFFYCGLAVFLLI